MLTGTLKKRIPNTKYLNKELVLRIDTGGCSVNCNSLSFRGLCNYTFQLTLYFLLILYVNKILYQMT